MKKLLLSIFLLISISCFAEEVPGYMRVDVDRLGTQIWFGATHNYKGANMGKHLIFKHQTDEKRGILT